MGGGSGGSEGPVSDCSSGYEFSLENGSRQSSDAWRFEVVNSSGKTEEEDVVAETEHHHRPILMTTTADEFDQTIKRINHQNTYQRVLQSYHNDQEEDDCLKKSVDALREQILSYKPGAWMHDSDGWLEEDEESDDDEIVFYDVPDRTTLLLVGPKGSGKSSLINRISSLFNEDNGTPVLPYRAQVFPSTDGGTGLLHGYTIPKRDDASISLYDTPGLPDTVEASGNDEALIRGWMTQGVFAEVVTISNPENRPVDYNKEEEEEEEDQCSNDDNNDSSADTNSPPVSDVNFVIFVVSAIPVLRAIKFGVEEDKNAMKMLAQRFNSQYLTLGDDKPVVVMTHGDLLPIEERARVRTHLGELFGIPPLTQIFDIPTVEDSDPSTDLATLNMLKYSLEHADKNLQTSESEDTEESENISPKKPDDAAFMSDINKVKFWGSAMWLLFGMTFLVSFAILEMYLLYPPLLLLFNGIITYLKGVVTKI